MLFPELEPRFRTTLIDAPWPERGGGKIKRGADRHYDLLDKPGARTVPQILRVIRSSPLWRPFPDAAHLWCWVTDNYLPAGLWLVEQLGFRFVRTFAWFKASTTVDVEGLEDLRPAPGDKPRALASGIGQYGRGSHELMLFAVRGQGMSPLVYQDNRSVRSAFVAPLERDENGGKKKHSRKPLKSYELIEARSKGPYSEIFARRGRPGWESWGNELPPPVAAEEEEEAAS